MSTYVFITLGLWVITLHHEVFLRAATVLRLPIAPLLLWLTDTSSSLYLPPPPPPLLQGICPDMIMNPHGFPSPLSPSVEGYLPGHDHEPARLPQPHDGGQAAGAAGRQGGRPQGQVPLWDGLWGLQGRRHLPGAGRGGLQLSGGKIGLKHTKKGTVQTN